MSELRWNPILGQWVVTATHRQERPHPALRDWCPFCPDSGLVPKEYDVFIYPNDYPTFSLPPPKQVVFGKDFYKVEQAGGLCDVILYHSNHNLTLAQLSLDHITKIIRLWVKRFRELAEKEEIQYVFIFENKGEVIGVTIHHPHGQIYAFPYIPPIIQKELDLSKAHCEQTMRCLFCEILQHEMQDGQRVVFENDSFFAFVPFFAKFPYEVHILPKRHFENFYTISEKEIVALAHMLKTILLKYDGLFNFSFPYMMVLHQSPVDGHTYPYFHFHIEFYPPYRAKDKLKYLAGCETGAGTFINDTIPEEKAQELRNIHVKF